MTPKYTYTLVSYRPNGEDFCRGSSMGASDSMHSISVHSTAELVADAWAQQLLRASGTVAREICAVEYTLLLNGRTYDIDTDQDQPENCNPQGVPGAELERIRVQALTQARLHALMETKREEAARKAAVAQANLVANAQAAQAALEVKERAELARLQAKFGVATEGAAPG